ncbi:MAG: hypothetical protein ABIF71_07455 [Planctomycetota bacterium]
MKDLEPRSYSRTVTVALADTGIVAVARFVPVLFTIPHILEGGALTTCVSEMNDRLRVIARKKKIPLIDDYAMFQSDIKGAFKGQFALTSAGYRRINQLFERVYGPLAKYAL